MATSRSGTTVHKRMVAQTIAAAKAQGVTHCGCGVELDYENRTARNGAHADEIVPYAVTGETSTDPDNWRVLCATCNQKRGAGAWKPYGDENPYPLSLIL